MLGTLNYKFQVHISLMHQHFIIHKPFGFLSQFIYNQSTRKNKKLLGDLHQFPEGTMSIGRLDQDSEGLLLLTTDGMVSEQIRSKKVEKEYFVQVDGLITDKAVELLKNGVEISLNGKKYLTLPSIARILSTSEIEKLPYRKVRDERHGPTSWVAITIVEGKFRQVRKMTAGVGFPTLRLIRVRIGHIHLHKLEAGEVVAVANFEPPCH